MPSYRSEKRLKEIARAKKREEKRQKKLAKKGGADPDTPQEEAPVEAGGESSDSEEGETGTP